MRKKRILRIFNRIKQICQKGRDYFIDYCVYIDGIIEDGQYDLLQDVFINFYSVDIRKYNTISIMKQKTFDVALFNTSSTFQYRLKDYYDLKGVYQIGQQIYDVSTNENLGTFTELDRLRTIEYLGVTYSYNPESPYYYDPELFEIIKEPSEVILEVLIGTSSSGERIYIDDPMIVLLDKYKIGINILLT
jgi:hypothetical protein